jgi:hypothetical protein
MNFLNNTFLYCPLLFSGKLFSCNGNYLSEVTAEAVRTKGHRVMTGEKVMHFSCTGGSWK